MIHSLSGGVLSDGEIHTFVKVQTQENTRWYICPFPVKEGDRVVVPFQYIGEREGIVLKVENCTAQTAPCSVRHATEILRIL